MLSERFWKEYEKNKELQSLKNKKNPDHEDSNRYAELIGEIVRKLIQEYKNDDEDFILSDDEYKEIKELERTSAKEIKYYTYLAQESLNKRANINMKAVKTRYDEERLKGLLAVGSLPLLATGSKNFLQSVNTDIIQVNAEKQAKAGFDAKLVRKTEPNCCKWCASLAGTYTPEEAKAKGIYARHEGCVCTIDFYPSKGKRQRISNYMKDAKTREKLAASSGREERIALAKEKESGIIQTRIYNGNVVNPMPIDRYSKMKVNLERIGVKVLQAKNDDLRYLESLKAEASYGHGYILHIGKIPSAAAMFEEIIHSQQAKKYGEFLSSDLKELAAREIYANRKLLEYSKAYGLDRIDVQDTKINLAKWEKLFKKVTGSDYNENKYYRGI